MKVTVQKYYDTTEMPTMYGWEKPCDPSFHIEGMRFGSVVLDGDVYAHIEPNSTFHQYINLQIHGFPMKRPSEHFSEVGLVATWEDRPDWEQRVQIRRKDNTIGIFFIPRWYYDENDWEWPEFWKDSELLWEKEPKPQSKEDK